jgi:hypothetical protein
VNAQVKKQAQKPGKTSKQVTVTFGAYPEEVERWKAAADKVDRPLSWWIRNSLRSLDGADPGKEVQP